MLNFEAVLILSDPHFLTHSAIPSFPICGEFHIGYETIGLDCSVPFVT